MLIDAAEQKNAAVYLAATRTSSRASGAGENRGKRLEHDFVVREWIGPIGFGESLKIEEKRALPLLRGANAKNLGVAAFVQNRSTSEVLQALMLPVCEELDESGTRHVYVRYLWVDQPLLVDLCASHRGKHHSIGRAAKEQHAPVSQAVAVCPNCASAKLPVGRRIPSQDRRSPPCKWRCCCQ